MIVVALIVIAGLAMVSVTRESLRLATDAVEQEVELQQRWGTISLQRTLLHAAPKIFLDAQRRSLVTGAAAPLPSTAPLPSSVQSDFLLGGLQFTTLLADEQAKLNLNTIYHTRGRNAVELTVRKMSEFRGLPVRLTPEVDSEARRTPSRDRTRIREDERDPTTIEEPDGATSPPAFRHWGQVFDLSRSSNNSLAVGRLIPAATSKLTLWGRGEINITTAPNEVVAEACREAVGPGVARQLVDQYRRNPLNLNQLALGLEVNDQQRQSLRRVVTTQSSTYSLWLTSKSINGSQRWFAVAAPVDSGIRIERFQF